jgi:isoleucyl-tRNA synthetase
LITEETNVKLVEKFDSKSGGNMFTKSVLPDLKRLGKAMGPRINELKQKLNDLSQEDILKIETTGLELTFANASTYTLTREDVLVKTTDAVGLASASDGNVTVALDTNISPELRNEGIARDFVNRIQNMRKDTGMEVQDKIRIYVAKKDELIDGALLANSEYICRETQALGLTLEESVLGATAVDMDEFELSVKIEK